MFISLEAEPREVEGQHLVTTPKGTVTITVDRLRGVCRVYSEPEPEPDDWDVATRYISNTGGRMAGAWAEGEVDVFEVIRCWGVSSQCRKVG